jgi:hypothetical protein
MTVKTEIDVELLIQWAYRDELSKRQTSSAEGIWDRVVFLGQNGGVDPGHGSAQRYSHFGLPDPDAERIEKAVSALEDKVIDWNASFDAIAGELGGLVSVNDMTGRANGQRKALKVGWGAAGTKALKAWWGDKGAALFHDRPRDVLMVGGIRTAALVTMHAIKGSRPDWIAEFPEPKFVPAQRGPNAMIVGECKGRNLYTTGSYCPLAWEPSPMSVVSSRAEYATWHHGLMVLSQTIELAKFIVLPPKASPTPWLDGQAQNAPVLSVLPTGYNDVGKWGILPLVPQRERAGPPPRARRAGEGRILATSPSA